jgi:hypothetical protein
MLNHSLALAVFLPASLVLCAAGDYTLHTFKKVQLSDQFWSEGANLGDFNKDGKPDLVSGPFWWEGPDFKTRHEYDATDRRKSPGGVAPFELKLGAQTKVTVPGFHGALGKENAYADNFFAFAHDLNRDGWDDILILGFPSAASYWHENPRGQGGHWKKHLAVDYTDNESPTFGDLTGDGKPELIFHTRVKEGTNMVSYLGYAEPDWNQPTAKWTFHKISTPGKWHWFNHGYGYGDVNGDGRLDLLEKDGWWEQPPSLAGDPVWKQHKLNLGTGGAQMYAYDVNGDGLNDIITSLAGHGYGLAWYEQLKERDPGGDLQFRQHIFMNKEPKENKYGVKFSQLHAIDLVDLDGDGLKDIITGKRFWAHGPAGDAEPGAPAVLYWFKLARGADKSVDFIPHLIDNDSGIGTQVVAADANGDGLPDVIVGNKKGTFLHLHSTRKVGPEEWEKAQPKPFAQQSAAAR